MRWRAKLSNMAGSVETKTRTVLAAFARRVILTENQLLPTFPVARTRLWVAQTRPNGVVAADRTQTAAQTPRTVGRLTALCLHFFVCSPRPHPRRARRGPTPAACQRLASLGAGG